MKPPDEKVLRVRLEMISHKVEQNALNFDCCPKMIIIAVPVRIRGCPAK